jgi:GH18 family chitinase
MYIEGGCRWGFDMIWEYPEPDESKMTKRQKRNYRNKKERLQSVTRMINKNLPLD